MQRSRKIFIKKREISQEEKNPEMTHMIELVYKNMKTVTITLCHMIKKVEVRLSIVCGVIKDFKGFRSGLPCLSKVE